MTPLGACTSSAHTTTSSASSVPPALPPGRATLRRALHAARAQDACRAGGRRGCQSSVSAGTSSMCTLASCTRAHCAGKRTAGGIPRACGTSGAVGGILVEERRRGWIKHRSALCRLHPGVMNDLDSGSSFLHSSIAVLFPHELWVSAYQAEHKW